ncbi:sulfotransferase [Yinghuangia sp. ASG 101]|uniref:sulfotransferase family protein n=1 Tax=Yinghuangia sp. ASG 101 TaxID=2896848 RepID=UPI001E465D4F|nr:sulfotransferase [Yinghuangia sp. ASG 101]UGQ11751.1 sulfotransferase [Yinghuangia sp. ASG 101]
MGPHDELLDAARAETGLDDFGDDAFREGLEILVRDLREHARLNAVGQAGLRKVVVDMLGQRLQVEDWYRRHPEIDDEPIEAPLIGIGLPRTGSTALSFVLAEDPQAKSLRRWEASQPCPPPSTVDGPDPRVETAKAEIAQIAKLSPRTLAMLPGSPTGPMECLSLLALDFKSHVFQAFAYVPNYSKWLLDTDCASAYAYERRVLKLLQWGFPAKPWRLKAPAHLLFLDSLDRAFPDARFVWTHRDPTAVILSVADLYTEVAGRFSDDVDTHYIGELNVEHWTVGIARSLAFRERCEARGEDRFHDIDFRAMQTDPIGQVRGLYAWLGEPVTPGFEAGMQAWWEEFAANREPSVHPDPATFGVDLDAVRPLFADYTARIPAWTSR